LLDVGDQVLVVGYPMFFYDEQHNLPIVKTGTVATPYKTIFQDKPVFLIDANLQKGASGSPLVTPQSNIQERGKQVVFGKYPAYLVRVNSAKYETLGLNVVWYASLILDIVTAR
jgi:Ni,Fe-hydrogenase maturation factor